MKQLIKKIFGLWILCALLAACGAAVGAGGDASAEQQTLLTPDGAGPVADAAQPTDDAALADDAVTLGDAAPVGDGAQPGADASDAAVPTDGAPRADAFDESPAVCGGCFLGAACVPSTPMACGSNSACVRCPTPRVPECQEATCTDGACGIRNLPNGTGCTGGVCVAGACYACGTSDNECCPAGNRCNPGLTCVAATGSTFQYCTGCGAAGQACCGSGVGTVTSGGSMPVARNPGGTCNAGLSCNAEGACTCGGLGEACCTGFTCREGRCRHDGTCGV